MKTVLAPGAPWPYHQNVELTPAKQKPKRKPPVNKQGRRKRTDEKFAEWMKKQGELL